jgi:hypothetical protein
MPTIEVMSATMTVTIAVDRPGDRLPVLAVCTIAARCPRCGARRGAPIPVVCYRAGCAHYCCVDRWANPCGHVDASEDVLLEAGLRCARPGCLDGWSVPDYPFCSPRCAARDLAAVVARWRSLPK